MKRKRAIFFILVAAASIATGVWAQTKPASRFVIRFSNGDQLHARPVSLQEGRLTFVPDVAPKGPVTVAASRIDSITCSACEVDSTPTADVLNLVDGSVLKGTFLRLVKDALVFQVAGLGEVAVPRGALASLLRAGTETSSPREISDEHVVSTKAGDILIGSLLPGADGTLIVEGKQLRATVNYASIRGIFFPAQPAAVPAKDAGADTLRMTVTLRNGTKLFGSMPTLVAGEFSLVIAGNHRLKVSSDFLRELSFSGTGAQARLRNVLVWGRYADRHQEFKRTVEVVTGGLKDWTVVEDFSDTFTPEFRTKLMSARTLLIPEMERWQSPRFRKGAVANAAELAAQLRSVTGPFLRAGGNVVILCPSRYQTDFLREAGLLDVAATKNYDNQEVAFTAEGAVIARGIGAKFKTANATQFYTIGTRLPAVAWALHGSESPVIGRKHGGGWVILLGMDFFARNEQTARLLVNAITLQ